MQFDWTIGIREKRLIGRIDLSNTKDYIKDLPGRYVGKPLERGNYVQAALGIPAAGWNAIWNWTDPLIADATGTNMPPRRAVPFDQTRSNISSLLGNIVHLRPIKALVTAIRLPGNMATDIVDTTLGYNDDTRSRIRAVMASERQHALAA